MMPHAWGPGSFGAAAIAPAAFAYQSSITLQASLPKDLASKPQNGVRLFSSNHEQPQNGVPPAWGPGSFGAAAIAPAAFAYQSSITLKASLPKDLASKPQNGVQLFSSNHKQPQNGVPPYGALEALVLQPLLQQPLHINHLSQGKLHCQRIWPPGLQRGCGCFPQIMNRPKMECPPHGAPEALLLRPMLQQPLHINHLSQGKLHCQSIWPPGLQRGCGCFPQIMNRPKMECPPHGALEALLLRPMLQQPLHINHLSQGKLHCQSIWPPGLQRGCSCFAEIMNRPKMEFPPHGALEALVLQPLLQQPLHINHLSPCKLHCQRIWLPSLKMVCSCFPQIINSPKMKCLTHGGPGSFGAAAIAPAAFAHQSSITLKASLPKDLASKPQNGVQLFSSNHKQPQNGVPPYGALEALVLQPLLQQPLHISHLSHSKLHCQSIWPPGLQRGCSCFAEFINSLKV